MGGIVSSMAAERKDYKLLQKNTRYNLSVDTWMDPNRPVTPDEPRTPVRVAWSEEVAEERIFYQVDQPNILLEPGQIEEDEEEYYDDDEDYGEESGENDKPAAPQRANSWGGAERVPLLAKDETQNIVRVGSERGISASTTNGNGSDSIPWNAES